MDDNMFYLINFGISSSRDNLLFTNPRAAATHAIEVTYSQELDFGNPVGTKFADSGGATIKTIDQIANELISGKEISKVNEADEIFFSITPLGLTEE